MANETGCVIEIGTNSVKMLVGKIKNDELETLIHKRRITRIGKGLDKTGVISGESIEKTKDCIVDFISEARKAGAGEVFIAATEGMRKARNAGEFKKKVKEETGIPIEVLPGEEEARLTALGAMMDFDIPSGMSGAVIDIGGGSTEVIIKGKPVSMPIGCVNVSEKFDLHGKPGKENVEEAKSFIWNMIEQHFKPGESEIFAVGVGGTVVTASLLMKNLNAYLPDEIHGEKFDFTQIEGLTGRLIELDINERKSLMEFDPERADVIIGGLLILHGFCLFFNVDKITSSVCNIIHGIFYEKFAGKGRNNDGHK